MEAYPDDPEAHALILGDFGDVKVESDWKSTYVRHRRIKILDEGGYDLANVSIVYNAEGNFQRVSKIQGQTFVREPDGKVRRVKLDKKSIFTEDLDDGLKRVKFTLPALAPGAVVEYRYQVRKESPVQLPVWYFQDEEPTLHSELRVAHPTDLAYTEVTEGAPEFVVRDKTEGVDFRGKLKHHRWVVQGVPALREEPFMTTLDDYVQKVSIQLAEYWDGFSAVRVIKTWEQLAKELDEHTNFGRKLNVGRDVRREAEAITAGLTSPSEKAKALYDYVRDGIVWDGNRRAFADERLEHVLRDKKGTSAEVNLLLVALLREAGLTASPAMLSTRGNGQIIQVYPLVSQFDYTVAAVQEGDGWTLLDATDTFMPYGMLPVRALNGMAFVPTEQPVWVSIPAGHSGHILGIDATLEGDGSLAGSLRSTKQGYAGIAARRTIREDGLDAYVADHLLDDVPGIEVGEVSVTGGEDPNEPSVVDVAFRIPSYAQAIGDLVLVNPLVMLRNDENPFKRERRTYPVDFAYPFATTYSARIVLPESYTLDETPEDALLLLPLRAGGYERSVVLEGDTLNVSARTQLRKTLFEPDVYTDVKKFFDRAVATDAETVVLKKVALADAVEPTPGASSEEVDAASQDSDGRE